MHSHTHTPTHTHAVTVLSAPSLQSIGTRAHRAGLILPPQEECLMVHLWSAPALETLLMFVLSLLREIYPNLPLQKGYCFHKKKKKKGLFIWFSDIGEQNGVVGKWEGAQDDFGYKATWEATQPFPLKEGPTRVTSLERRARCDSGFKLQNALTGFLSSCLSGSRWTPRNEMLKS